MHPSFDKLKLRDETATRTSPHLALRGQPHGNPGPASAPPAALHYRRLGTVVKPGRSAPDEVTNKDGRQHSEKKSPPGCPARPPSHRVHPCRHLGWGLRLSGVPRYANTTATATHHHTEKTRQQDVNSRDCSMLPLAGNVLRKRASEADKKTDEASKQ